MALAVEGPAFKSWNDLLRATLREDVFGQEGYQTHSQLQQIWVRGMHPILANNDDDRQTVEGWGLVASVERTNYGRSTDADVTVANDTVGALHCELTRFGETTTLTDLDSSGTFVNGDRISQGNAFTR